jgi:uncharacterized protein (DUF983 family)
MVGRALLRRCPWCSGRGAWFVGWFSKQDHCKTCGLRWDRNQDGWELGAMMIAIVAAIGAVAVVLIVGIAASYPDIAVFPILALGLVVAVVVPVIGYPFSYTLWSAVDLAVHPPEAEEFAAHPTASS